MYYQRLMNADGQKNSKSFFDCISRLKGKVASQDRLNKETADKFIDHFSTVGKTLASNFESKSENISKSSSNSVQSMRLTRATSLEVREIINKMRTKYSTDCFELNNFFLKKLEWVIVPILTKLINKCIGERSFPPCLKEAIIVAVHKSGDVREPSNFRPISLLPTVAKDFETFLYNKIFNFLEVFDLLDANQYGFRRQRGTIDALAHFVENARDTLENQTKCSIGLFLDLKKAFDTVDHNLLLKKIANIGLRGPMLEIMKSYLSDRKQILRYGAARTSPRTVTFGVPQGSVLGPLLFIIYVNDIRQQCSCSTIKLYVDDTALQPKKSANEVFFKVILTTSAST